MSLFVWFTMILCVACIQVPLDRLFACLALSWGNTTDKRLNKQHVLVRGYLLLLAVRDFVLPMIQRVQ